MTIWRLGASGEGPPDGLYEDHGERPFTIVWRLVDGPIPAELLIKTRVAVA